MHEVTKHKLMHVAHAYMPATNCLCCMWEFHTKEKAIRQYKIEQKNSLSYLRFFAPQGLGYGREVAKSRTNEAEGKSKEKLNWATEVDPEPSRRSYPASSSFRVCYPRGIKSNDPAAQRRPKLSKLGYSRRSKDQSCGI